jgi:hypothetical protein
MIHLERVGSRELISQQFNIFQKEKRKEPGRYLNISIALR